MISELAIKKELTKKKDAGVFPKDWIELIQQNILAMQKTQLNGNEYNLSRNYIKVYFAPSKADIVSRPLNEAAIKMLIDAEKRAKIEMAKIEMMGNVSLEIEEILTGLRVELYKLRQLDERQMTATITQLKELRNNIKDNI